MVIDMTFVCILVFLGLPYALYKGWTHEPDPYEYVRGFMDPEELPPLTSEYIKNLKTPNQIEEEARKEWQKEYEEMDDNSKHDMLIQLLDTMDKEEKHRINLRI